MSDLSVHIMLHGLLALVPINGPQGVNHMTALLIDGAKPRPDIECFKEHTPMLKVVTSDLECGQAGCSLDEGLCVCAFPNSPKEITLSPDIQPLGQTLQREPTTSLPFNRTKATQFAYVADLSLPPFSQTLNRKFLDPVPPKELIGRMTFPFDATSKACSLATRRDEGGYNVHPLSFRKLGDDEAENEPNQALSQMFMAHYVLPDTGLGTPTLTLTLSDFGGANPHSMVLSGGANNEVFIQLMNHRPDSPVDDHCDDGIARDFAILYELANNPPSIEERKVPHIKYTRWKSAVELFDQACQAPKTPLSRPICPVGSFDVEQGGSSGN